MTITIHCTHLRVPDLSPQSGDDMPLSALDDDARSHVHGALRVEIDGRRLPWMGFFGPDDVCLNDWARELSQARHTLSTSDVAVHVFDEGEQGQPAFEFRREGERVFVSIVDSTIGDGRSDPAWQRVPCRWHDFDTAVRAFVRELRAALEAEAPEAMARAWCHENIVLDEHA
ncbi:MAG: hypothetical protein H6834_06515 [Planctomycetes bacterium]|nr:hypothetical protein [Planctomycetota bacterium]